MPDKIDIHIDGADAMSRKISELIKLGGGNVKTIVRGATISTIRSLRSARSSKGRAKLTPVSKNERKQSKTGWSKVAYKKAGKKHYKWKIEHYKGRKSEGIPKGKLGYWYTNQAPMKTKRRRKIRYKGAARAGWLGVMRKMGIKGSSQDIQLKARKLARSASGYSKGGSGMKHWNVIHNKIRYVGKIAPNSVNIALSRAARDLEFKVFRKIERKWERSWG